MVWVKMGSTSLLVLLERGHRRVARAWSGMLRTCSDRRERRCPIPPPGGTPCLPAPNPDPRRRGVGRSPGAPPPAYRQAPTRGRQTLVNAASTLSPACSHMDRNKCPRALRTAEQSWDPWKLLPHTLTAPHRSFPASARAGRDHRPGGFLCDAWHAGTLFAGLRASGVAPNERSL